MSLLENPKYLDVMLKASISGVCVLLSLMLLMNITDRIMDPMNKNRANWCKFKSEL